MHFIAVLLNRC
jgi:hypothetical protein